MPDDEGELLQHFVDSLFRDASHVARIDAVLRAEAFDLSLELLGIVALLPPGTHSRQALCDQVNSALIGHGWTGRYGTVE